MDLNGAESDTEYSYIRAQLTRVWGVVNWFIEERVGFLKGFYWLEGLEF